ncbi:MAG: hypothetical protein LUI14_14525 [Lachnospiraceae bacterium]|nr:hypothetical protein [Lachnospiraceae bacterium]
MNKYQEVIMEEIRWHKTHRPVYWDKTKFSQWSYKGWALDQLYDIASCPDTCPIMIKIEEFISLMDKYQCMSSMFSPAYDEAIYIYDLCGDVYEEELYNEAIKHY